MVKRILQIALRECGILIKNPMYGFCMIIFPLLVIFFFTSLLNEGQPVEMPFDTKLGCFSEHSSGCALSKHERCPTGDAAQ